MADTVSLTDLEVIQQFSLAVRGATAERADVIAALEADLAYLRGAKRAVTTDKATATEKAAPAKSAPVKKAAPAKKAPAKKAPVKAPRSRA